MSSPERDPRGIKGDDLENDPAASVFSAYQRARRRQADDEAVVLWERFVVMGYPLMRNKVARLVGRSDLKWLGYDDIDDVAQEAFLRAKGMALTFDGQAVGQGRAALIKTAFNTARDHQRRQDVRRRDVAGSIDEPHTYDDGTAANPWEAKAAGTEDWTTRLALGELELDRILAATRRIPSEDQRKVLLLTWQGYESKEIAEMIGKGQNNVDKLRERGLTKLKEILTNG